MHIKPRAIATVLCMIFFIGFAVCGVVRSTDKETSEIRQSYPVLAEAEPVIMADLLSAALLFGGLAITVVTIQTDEEEYEDE